MTCSACRFWSESRSGIGRCRRRAPAVDTNGLTVWPSTVAEDACGEFSARPAEAQAEPLRVARLGLGPEDDAEAGRVELLTPRIRRHQRIEPGPPATGTQELTLPRGWLTDALAKAMGVRCGHPNGFEVQLSVGGTARCPDCAEPQKAQESAA